VGATLKKEGNQMNITQRKVTEIKPYGKNPRKNNDAMKYVAASIQEFGFKVPIVIDKNGIIVAGHTRWKAAKWLGLSEVPCIIADDLTDEQIKAFRLADNKVAEKAEWDFDLLAEELDDLFDFDMSVFGFGEDEEEAAPVPPERTDLSDSIGETFEIVITCKNELEQEEIFYKLTNEGYECRTLTL